MNDITDASCRDFRAKVHLLSRLVLDLGRVPEESAHAMEGVGVVLLARVELQGQVVAEAVGHVLAGPARVHAPQFAAILRGRHPFTLQINDFLEIKCAHTQYVKIQCNMNIRKFYTMIN